MHINIINIVNIINATNNRKNVDSASIPEVPGSTAHRNKIMNHNQRLVRVKSYVILKMHVLRFVPNEDTLSVDLMLLRVNAKHRLVQQQRKHVYQDLVCYFALFVDIPVHKHNIHTRHLTPLLILHLYGVYFLNVVLFFLHARCTCYHCTIT